MIRKLTENKFKPGVPKPELVEDWDQRILVTKLTLNQGKDGFRLLLEHEADKDQKFASDSDTEYRLEEDGDILVVTSTIGEVVAWRRLRRQEGGRDQGAG